MSKLRLFQVLFSIGIFVGIIITVEDVQVGVIIIVICFIAIIVTKLLRFIFRDLN